MTMISRTFGRRLIAFVVLGALIGCSSSDEFDAGDTLVLENGELRALTPDEVEVLPFADSLFDYGRGLAGRDVDSFGAAFCDVTAAEATATIDRLTAALLGQALGPDSIVGLEPTRGGEAAVEVEIAGDEALVEFFFSGGEGSDPQCVAGVVVEPHSTASLLAPERLVINIGEPPDRAAFCSAWRESMEPVDDGNDVVSAGTFAALDAIAAGASIDRARDVGVVTEYFRSGAIDYGADPASAERVNFPVEVRAAIVRVVTTGRLRCEGQQQP